MNDITEMIIEIVRRAGAMAREKGYSRIDDKDSKDNHVTDMDVAVEAFLKKELLELVPGSSFIGEEEDFQDNHSRYCWIVDPIDGTTNFIRHIPVCAVSVALMKDGVGEIGVVFNPFTSELFHAERGGGAFLNGQPIHVSGNDLAHSIFGTSWGAYDKTVSGPVFDIAREVYFKCEDIRRLGSAAYEICKMSQGGIDVYFEPILYPWDYAAASIVLREAGGVIGDLYGEPDYRNRTMICAANSAESLEYIRSVVRRAYRI